MAAFAAYENDITNENNTIPEQLYENVEMPHGSNGSDLVISNGADVNRTEGMELRKNVPSCDKTESTVPHKIIGGVEYAEADVKSKVAVFKRGGQNIKDSDKQCLIGTSLSQVPGCRLH